MRLSILLVSIMVNTSLSAGIELSKTIPLERKTLIREDINYLKSLPSHQKVSPKFKELFQVEDFNSDQLYRWLDTRVNYILAADTKFKEILSIKNFNVDYPNPFKSQLLPTIEIPEKIDDLSSPKNQKNAQKIVTVMTNSGSSLYMAGKQESLQFQFLFNEKIIAVKSPRVGLLHVGEGLFLKDLIIQSEKSSSASSINRLITFFHEARHSDGNSEHLGFPHTICPIDHDYANRYACDESLNGAYTVGAEISKALIESCSTCDIREKIFLQVIAADNYNRVLQEKHIQVIDDNQHEFLLKLIESQKIAIQLATNSKVKADELEKLKYLEEQLTMEGGVSVFTTVKTTNLDPTPESL